MDLKQLRYFMAIVEERQITAAARRLHMAQPPLSNQMKMLEDEIGLQLFRRGPHHIELTEAGELLAARAAQLLDMAAMTKRELQDLKQGLCGTLAIGTVSSSGNLLMHEGMQAFRAKFPRVHFEIHDGNTYQLIDMLEKRLIEIAIVRTPFNAARFNCKYRQPEPMIAAMTPVPGGAARIMILPAPQRPLPSWCRVRFSRSGTRIIVFLASSVALRMASGTSRALP